MKYIQDKINGGENRIIWGMSQNQVEYMVTRNLWVEVWRPIREEVFINIIGQIEDDSR